MAVTIHIPTPLRRFTGAHGEVRADGMTVGEALRDLVRQHPAIERHLYADDGSLRSFVNLFLNDEDVRHLQRGDTPLSSGDTLMIVPSIAGGAGAALEGKAEEVAAEELTPAEIRHYSRHLIMPEIGPDGQKRLKAAKVLMVGAGGLGSPLGLYLAAAGVGTLGIVDFDVVDESNLHRQVLYGAQDVGRPKLHAAIERLRGVNPHIRLVPHEMRLDSGNALDLCAGYDIVVDGTDNFPTRYLVNDACVLLGKPNVFGSIFRFEGQVSIFWGARGPCYRCLFPEPPPPGLVPSCAEGGVLGVLPGIIGSLQANEVIKLIAGVGDPLIGRLLLFDALKMKFRELKLRKDPGCPVCSEHPTQTGLIDYNQFCGIPQEQARVEDDFEMSVTDLKRWMDEGRDFKILDVRTPQEHQIAHLPGTRLIPLQELPGRLGELDPADTLVVHCHHGGRSAQAVELLRRKGFAKSINLAGGIHAWSEEIDPSVPRY
ncbi:MAG TPA: molybdopterin-synthase adenylyltransferase MoeB [Thermoanaerobaculia bacterium]|nr:molybdopterin-synthase adenylyltransferase MoeB [Thermoanaerobaculia bacterium]